MNPPSAIAHYKFTSKLGQGGMGEVWRATDTRLGRDVAIKILPEAFAQDADRMARFTREAQVLASLNHPNIAAIYGLEDRAIVMELVDGKTLAERIERGPVPLDEGLPIARQIADALEAAHEKGIVHRDLKPAIVKITPAGTAKVLDFGLAKNTDRAVIWAFGVLLYEMLTAAVTRIDRDNRNLWIVDFARGTTARFTFDPGSDQTPVWSPDGNQIIFRSSRAGRQGLYRKPVDGSKDEELLLESNDVMTPTSWSRDGRFLLYDRRNPKSSHDMWILSLDDLKTRPLLNTGFDEGEGVFSADARWIAYLSNESGRAEVYVKAFLPDGSVQGKWMVSRGALAWEPRWRGDSKERYYVALDSTLMSVAVLPGAQFVAGPPKPFGTTPIGSYGDLAPDGKRVLAPLPVAQEAPSPFTFVLHWQSALGLNRR